MSDPAEKTRRQREILTVLGEEAIASQEQLRKALKRRGFPVTQATLSRDLWDLKVVRVPVEDDYRYLPSGEGGGKGGPAEATSTQLRSVAAVEVTAIDSNEMCVIVRTLTGRAQGVAVVIDGLKLEDALATVAGDDTIMV